MKILIFSALLGFSTAHATFVPQDVADRWAKERANRLSSEPIPSMISEAEFKELITQFQKAFEGNVAQHGGKLDIGGEWKNNTPNAFANQTLGRWQVKVTGGLARHPLLTKDGLSLIICHEIGHHLGGFPYAQSGPIGGAWAASEGQSDYFATHTCTRRFWGNDVEENMKYWRQASREVVDTCQKVWSHTDDLALCARVLEAISSMTATMANLMKVEAPKISTPDQTQVDQTNLKHPKVQCRFDTSLEGAVCLQYFDPLVIPGKGIPGPVNGPEAEKQSALLSCSSLTGFNIGLRPRCWFSPRF